MSRRVYDLLAEARRLCVQAANAAERAGKMAHADMIADLANIIDSGSTMACLADQYNEGRVK